MSAARDGKYRLYPWSPTNGDDPDSPHAEPFAHGPQDRTLRGDKQGVDATTDLPRCQLSDHLTGGWGDRYDLVVVRVVWSRVIRHLGDQVGLTW